MKRQRVGRLSGKSEGGLSSLLVARQLSQRNFFVSFTQHCPVTNSIVFLSFGNPRVIARVQGGALKKKNPNQPGT